MRNASRNLAVLAATFSLGALAATASAQSLKGRWAATITQGGVTIPFRLDIAGDGDKAVGTLYNGEDKETTTSASIRDGKVELVFEHYLTAIIANVKDGELDGQVGERHPHGDRNPRVGPGVPDHRNRSRPGDRVAGRNGSGRRPAAAGARFEA
jgi:hypothetical protein